MTNEDKNTITHLLRAYVVFTKELEAVGDKIAGLLDLLLDLDPKGIRENDDGIEIVHGSVCKILTESLESLTNTNKETNELLEKALQVG